MTVAAGVFAQGYSLFAIGTAKSKIEKTIARVAELAHVPDLGFTVISSVGKAYIDNMQHHITISINMLSS
jgi:hypothetical protein